MKKKILTKFIQFLILFLFISFSKQQVDVANGLVAHFGFDNGQVHDNIKNKYGTIVGGVSQTEDRFGRQNKALNFNGSNGYITLGLSDFSHLDVSNDLTITVWVKASRKNMLIIDNRARWDDCEQGYQFQINNNGQLLFVTGDDGTNRCYDTIFGNPTDCKVQSNSGDTKVQNGVWTHIAMTKANKTVYFYINGERLNANQGAPVGNIAYTDQSNERYIGTAKDSESWGGKYYTGTNRYAQGSMDDMRIYGRALSYSEINTIYKFEPSQNCNDFQPENSTCLSCQGNRSLKNNQCVCIDGQYVIQNQTNCGICNSKCKKCQTSSTNCLECSDSNKLFENGSCTNCQPQYYNDSQQKCQQCNIQCESCFGSSTSCTKCYSILRDVNNTCNCISNFVEQNGQCVCQEGKYNKSNQICEDCMKSCQTCINSTQCQTCKQSNPAREGSECKCPDGYFDDGIQSQCQKCHDKCKRCTTNATTCDECSHPLRELNKDCICKANFVHSNTWGCECQVGWFNQGDIQCQQCMPSCKNCINDTSCSECQASLPARINSKCECPEGYYDLNNQAQCERCHDKCKSCSNDPTSCKECVHHLRDINNGCKCKSNFVHTNTWGCECEVGFYNNGDINCESCMRSCISCLNGNSCQTCKISMPVREGVKCECPKGYFDDGIQSQCQKCHGKCESCSLNATNCSVCSDPLRDVQDNCNCKANFIDNATWGCECVVGQFNQGNISCEKCMDSCVSCVNGTSCGSCVNSNPQRVGSNCECPIGYYDDKIQAQCQQCHGKCKKCTINATTCDECVDPLRDINNECKCKANFVDTNSWGCECQEGQFNQGDTICEKCMGSCISCVDGTSCASCKQSNPLREGSKCECPIGYFDDHIQAQCQKCHGKCKKCSINATTCDECVDHLRELNNDCNCKSNFVDNSTWGCECQEGLYNQGDIKCEQCIFGCQSCTNGSGCSSCKISNPQRINSKCQCPEGYYDDLQSSQCQRCLHSCTSCTDGQSCSICQTSIPNRINQKCECPQRYYDDNISAQCQSCSFKCGSCSSDAFTCSSCSDPSRDPSKNCQCREGLWEKGVAICQDGCSKLLGTYDDGTQNCALCDTTKCITCENSPSKCTKCAAQKNRTTTPPNCDCEHGYFENKLKLCERCDGKCKQCEQKINICTECSNSAFAPPNCDTISQGSYSITLGKDLAPIRKQCNSQCEVCEVSANSCLKCRQDAYRNDNPPFCDCISGYYQNEIMKKCLKCSPHCIKCEYNKCLQCEENREPDVFTGKCICKKGFKQNSSQICLQCYQYKGDCLFICPNNTLKQGQFCKDIKYFTSSILLYIYIGFGILIAIKIISFKYGLTKLSSINQNNNFINSKQISKQISHIDIDNQLNDDQMEVQNTFNIDV